MHGKAVLYTGAPGQRVKAHNDFVILDPNQSKSPTNTAYALHNFQSELVATSSSLCFIKLKRLELLVGIKLTHAH